jgi:hypothetical protein
MDNPIFGLLLALFAAVWVYSILRGVSREFKSGDRSNWFVGSMALLVIIGACGFFGSGMAAVGILKIPKWFEWPAGNVCGIQTTNDGNHVVPLVPSGRVQIYDANWHFLHGWQVGAHGGDFKLECRASGRIEVYTGRGNQHYSYTENGDLISATTYSESDSPRNSAGSCVVVRTSPLGWVFSSPFFSWGTAVIGIAGLAILKKLKSG